MQIAVAADFHLTTLAKNPERFHALEDILRQLTRSGIKKLIVAGDLFDLSTRNYTDFEQLCGRDEFQGVEIIVLPGNHDTTLTPQAITCSNVRIVTEPMLQRFDERGCHFLLLPFAKKTMGECISEFSGWLAEQRWILVAHGDWLEGTDEVNPLEPGIYMPLTRFDLESFKPLRVVLGHIHKPMDRGTVHYVGSPVGLNIAETGYRRFLVLDSETGTLEARRVNTDVLYCNERFVMVPLPDETAYLQQQIAARIAGWGIAEPDLSKVQIKVTVNGYSADRRRLKETVLEAFSKFQFYQNAEPDLTQVAVADDANRAEIATRVSSWIEQNLASTNGAAEQDQVLLQALRTIYGD